MRPLAALLIISGIGNSLYLPIHLIWGSEVSTATATAASVAGIALVITGIGTRLRKIYGWKWGFVALGWLSIVCIAITGEMILNPPTPRLIALVAGISILFLFYAIQFGIWWYSKRPWFEPADDSEPSAPEKTSLHPIHTSLVNREIQLHDCELSDLTHRDGSTSIVLSFAEVHESSGIPGYDPGQIWTQTAVISISGTTPVSFDARLPIWVYDGSLLIGQTLHVGFIPASGHFDETTELIMTLSTDQGDDAGKFSIKGNGIQIELTGERSQVGEFNETPRRSIG